MKADRKKIINGYKIEECYWAGRTVCYVDDRLSNATFDENVALLSDNSGYEPRKSANVVHNKPSTEED